MRLSWREKSAASETGKGRCAPCQESITLKTGPTSTGVVHDVEGRTGRRKHWLGEMHASLQCGRDAREQIQAPEAYRQ
jgi:hypothetical protein